MDQAVIKFYRKLIKEDFPNFKELENASIYIEAIGQHVIHCNETGNYMKIYLQVDDGRITDAKYTCSCEPIANVVVEILCELIRGLTLEESTTLTEEMIIQVIGSNDEEIRKKVRVLLDMLHEGIISYTSE